MLVPTLFTLRLTGYQSSGVSSAKFSTVSFMPSRSHQADSEQACFKASSPFDTRGEGIYSPPRNSKTSDWVRPTAISSR